MSRLLGATTALIVLLMTTAFVARIAGARQVAPVVDALLADRCSPLPCWRGVRPGITSLAQAYDVLRSDAQVVSVRYTPPYELKWDADSASVWRHGYIASGTKPLVDSLLLYPNAGAFRLGEAMLVFGKPTQALICRRQGRIEGGIFFANNVMAAISVVRRPLEAPWLSPELPIDTLFFGSFDLSMRSTTWHGFTGFKIYTCG